VTSHTSTPTTTGGTLPEFTPRLAVDRTLISESLLKDRVFDRKAPPAKVVSGIHLDPLTRQPTHGGKVYRSDRGTFEVYAAILGRYTQLGGPKSYLGYPLSEEMDADEGGRMSVFEHGSIMWWPDTGAIDVGQVVVKCIGVHAFGITNGPGSDEIYSLFTVTSPDGARALRTPIAGDVDAKETHGYDLELYRGRPAGLVLSASLMEHDHGNPDAYLKQLQGGVSEVMEAGEKALQFIPVFGPILSEVHDRLVTDEVKAWIAQAISDIFGLEDDRLGSRTMMLRMKQMVTTADRSPLMSNWGWKYDVESELFSALGGSWKLLFTITRA